MKQLLSYQEYCAIVRSEEITQDHLTVYNHYVKNSAYTDVAAFKQAILDKTIPTHLVPKKTWQIYNIDTHTTIGHTFFINNLIVGIKIHNGKVGENYNANWLNTPFYNTKHSTSIYEPWEEIYTVSTSAESKWDRKGNVIQRNMYCYGYSKLPPDIKKDLTCYAHKDIILTYSRKTSGSRVIVTKHGNVNPIYRTTGITL